MSALGQKQTLGKVRPMSALPPKADMDQHGGDVRFVPTADFGNSAGRLGFAQSKCWPRCDFDPAAGSAVVVEFDMESLR